MGYMCKEERNNNTHLPIAAQEHGGDFGLFLNFLAHRRSEMGLIENWKEWDNGKRNSWKKKKRGNSRAPRLHRVDPQLVESV